MPLTIDELFNMVCQKFTCGLLNDQHLSKHDARKKTARQWLRRGVDSANFSQRRESIRQNIPAEWRVLAERGAQRVRKTSTLENCMRQRSNAIISFKLARYFSTVMVGIVIGSYVNRPSYSDKGTRLQTGELLLRTGLQFVKALLAFNLSYSKTAKALKFNIFNMIKQRSNLAV